MWLALTNVSACGEVVKKTSLLKESEYSSSERNKTDEGGGRDVVWRDY